MVELVILDSKGKWPVYQHSRVVVEVVAGHNYGAALAVRSVVGRKVEAFCDFPMCHALLKRYFDVLNAFVLELELLLKQNFVVGCKDTGDLKVFVDDRGRLQQDGQHLEDATQEDMVVDSKSVGNDYAHKGKLFRAKMDVEMVDRLVLDP